VKHILYMKLNERIYVSLYILIYIYILINNNNNKLLNTHLAHTCM
jgi:hypothetical protein